ncbi:MAG: putative lipid II flippase FtsW [Gammaproteobacteria bacterium]|nr:putative lipid II flippase FtsW [Gammaproteobacteria bacterium]
MSMAQKTRIATVGRCPLDSIVAGVALLLLLSGLIMVASASTEVSAKMYGSPFHLVTRHAVYLFMSATVGALVLLVPMNLWQKAGIPLLALSFLLLIAVFLPGIGKEVNGAVRWISLGSFTLQGSEFVKLFVIVYLAGYLVRRKEEVQTNFAALLKPLAIVAPLVLLLLGQPDFGATVVIMTAFMGVIFLAGIQMRYLLPVVSVCVAAISVIATLQPYRLARLTVFTDPWEHQFGGGYQLTQALIAFGRGEWFGLGLGNSIQKLFFLPEAHTDFLFSIIAEELGVVGAATIIILFACLIIRALWIGYLAHNQGEDFHSLTAYGIALLLGVQTLVNLGVNLGMLPTKGLTLPLMSYGGNSLIVSCMLVAILLRIEYECRTGVETSAAPTAKRSGKRG